VSGGFQGPFVRATHGSASDEAAKAPDPLGPSGKSSLPAASRSVNCVNRSSCNEYLPREREASLFVLANPLPMGLLPQMPLEACHVPPLPNV
jgi:hypothetical protein